MDLFSEFKDYFERHALLDGLRPVLVGVSGGVDSTVLLDLLRRVGVTVHVVHVNYGFRGAESDADEALVASTCARWEIPFTVHRASASWRDATAGKSLQEAARDLRYDVMFDTAKSTGSETVAVAHNLDDQAETVLLRFFRGSGVESVAGMRVRRPLRRHEDVVLVRPLLFATRREIAEYASQQGLHFRADASNLDPRFDRVRVRHTVLPAIREAFGDAAVRNITEVSMRLAEIVDHGVGPLIDADLEPLVDEHATHVRLDVEGLRALPSARRRPALLRALHRYLPRVPHRTSVIERIEGLMTGPPGKHVRFGSSSVWRDRSSLVFVPVAPAEPRESTPILPDGRNETAFGSITVERIEMYPGAESGGGNVEVMDGSVLEAPLSIGPWQPGERFQPLGLSGTKKISDFLTDRKVPTYLRKSIPVVRSGGAVVWIPGLRLAHPYRITDKSISAVRMRFENENG
ncbi:MAG TPA: tRNA lysidine(34) synthetase TilS [Rhodothermales bacterium]